MQGEAYQPSGDVLKRLNQVDFVAVVGPTAAGKSTLINQAKQRDVRIHEVISTTSRAPRPEERDGIDLHFKSRSEMVAAMQARKYVQVVLHPSGDMYATEADGYSTEGVTLMPVLAAVIPVFRSLPFKRLRIVYILPPNWDTWMARIVAHGFTPEQQSRRLEEAHQSLQFAVDDPQVVFVINDDLRQATDDFMGLVLNDAIDPDQQAKARILAADLLMQLIK